MDITQIIAQLTLQEKAGLLSGISSWHTTPIDRLGIPTTQMADGPTGLRKELGTAKFLAPSRPATCFPLPVTQASTWNPDLIKEMATCLAAEAIDQGVDIVLGPGTNIKRSPLGGRNFEYFSEDPILSGRMAISFIEGVQSRGIGTSLKHFAINNQETRRMTISAEVSIRAMREIYLQPFELAIKQARPKTVMCSYNRINGIQASHNKWLLTDLLRTSWGYQGLVMSDWGAVADRVKGVVAGLDLEMPTSNGLNDSLIIKAVSDGRLAIEDVDKAVANVLRYVEAIVKERTKREQSQPYDYALSHELARRVAVEGAVLLKNNDDFLPLKPGTTIAVIGAMARNPRYQGSGSSQVNPKHLISFIDALNERQERYLYADGYGRDFTKKLQEAKRIAAGTDVVLLFIGLPDEYESEGFDRTHINLPKQHLCLVEEILKVNPRVAVVLSLGAPVALPFVEKVPAILNMYLAGEAGGEAAYDILFGRASPSGRLAETFPKKLEDHPSHGRFPMGPQQVVYEEDIYVGYRHFDKAKKDVLFPFGHGLGYAKFRYENLVINGDFLHDGYVTIAVDIVNISHIPGAEVVQVYVGEMRPIVDRALAGLKAFAKVSLAPRQTKTVTMKLDETAFRYFDDKLNDWNIIPGDFKVLVGSSSRDIRLSAMVYIEGKTSLVPEQYRSMIPISRPEHGERNARYTRKTIDGSATFLDAKSVSLNGWIMYQAIKLGATSMVPKGISRTTKMMVRQSAIMMPLRQLALFSNGKLSHAGIEAVILIIKGRLCKGLRMLFANLKNQKNHPDKKKIFSFEEKV